MKEPMMMLITGTNEGKNIFQLITVNKNSPYMEATFDTIKKTLTTIAEPSYETLQMVARVNDHGVFEKSPTHKSGYKQERLRLHQHFSYQISSRKDIETFVKLMTGQEHDLSEYFIVEEKSTATTDPSLQANKKLEVVKDSE